MDHHVRIWGRGRGGCRGAEGRSGAAFFSQDKQVGVMNSPNPQKGLHELLRNTETIMVRNGGYCYSPVYNLSFSSLSINFPHRQSKIGWIAPQDVPVQSEVLA